MNKAALLITGVAVPNKEISFTEIYQGMLRCFPKEKFDYYFQSWDNSPHWKTFFTENNIEGPCYLYPEPTPYNSFVNYGKKHLDIPDQQFNPEHRPLQWYIFGDVYSENSYVIRKHNQMVGTALLIDEIEKRIPKLYTTYVRTRWDLILDHQFTNWEAYAENCMLKPRNIFGFAGLNQKGSLIIDWIRRFGKKEMSDYYIPDLVIFFNRLAFDTKAVLEVHERRNLLGAEWGWGQTLIHLSPLKNTPIVHKIHTSDVMIARLLKK